VDDIILARNFMSDIKIVKDSINQVFRNKDLGQLKYFLSLEMFRSHKGIHVCEKKIVIIFF